MKLRQISIAVALAAFTATLTAASPHFLRASASLDSSGQLAVSFKEAGLGNNDIIVEASADASATYYCINRGGKNPSAANKRTINQTVTDSEVFSPKNGQLTASLRLEVPGPGDFSCPSGQRLVLGAVSYANVAVTDITNDVTQPIPGTYSVTFFTPR
jgi:hypothetical protein